MGSQVRYLPRLDREKWYVISTTDRGWREQRHTLHGANMQAGVSWSVFSKHGFGYGFQVGRNGSESDLGLDLYVGRLGSVWLRLRSPWTRFARIDKDSGDPDWYQARHYGFRLFYFRGCQLRLELGALEHGGTSRHPNDPVFHRRRFPREWSLTSRTFLGLNRSEQRVLESGTTRVPMPEGNYGATWERVEFTTRYTYPLGRLRDRVLGPRRHVSVDLRIPGGIPHEGKGENSWDCGMDGLMGCSGKTVEDAVANAVRASLRDREAYGGPHNLPHPMSVSEAEQA